MAADAAACSRCFLLPAVLCLPVSNPSKPAQAPETRGLPATTTLASVALVLFVFFLVVAIGPIFPWRIQDPAWQIRFCTTLITSAPMALIGLAFHQIAVTSGTPSPRLIRRHRFLSQLALFASIGFLLLLPLQGSASLRQSQIVQQVQQQRIQNAEKRLAALRQVVATASSNAQLNTGLQQFDGPVLGPADLAQPLPVLKGQVDVVLNQAALQIRRERETNPPARRIVLLPDLIRYTIANLALAFGFASLSRRPGAHKSPLQELQDGWNRQNRYRAAKLTSIFDPVLDLVDRIRIALRR